MRSITMILCLALLATAGSAQTSTAPAAARNTTTAATQPAAALNGDQLFQRGRESYRAGRYADAASDLRAAAAAFLSPEEKQRYIDTGKLVTLPQVEQSLVYLALAYSKLGKTAEARDAVTRLVNAERIAPTFASLPLDPDAADYPALVAQLSPGASLPQNAQLARAGVSQPTAIAQATAPAPPAQGALPQTKSAPASVTQSAPTQTASAQPKPATTPAAPAISPKTTPTQSASAQAKPAAASTAASQTAATQTAAAQPKPSTPAATATSTGTQTASTQTKPAAPPTASQPAATQAAAAQPKPAPASTQTTPPAPSPASPSSTATAAASAPAPANRADTLRQIDEKVATARAEIDREAAARIAELRRQADERVAAEKAAIDKDAQARIATARAAAQKMADERIAAERAAIEREADAKIAANRAAADKAAQEKIAADRAAAQKGADAQIAADRAAVDRAAADRAAQQAAADRTAAAKAAEQQATADRTFEQKIEQPAKVETAQRPSMPSAPLAGADQQTAWLNSIRQADALSQTGSLAEANKTYASVATAPGASREVIAAAATGLYRIGAFRDAVDAFRRIGPLVRGEEDLRYYNAVSLFETGRYDEAKRELACALPYIQATNDVLRYRAMIEGMPAQQAMK